MLIKALGNNILAFLKKHFLPYLVKQAPVEENGVTLVLDEGTEYQPTRPLLYKRCLYFDGSTYISFPNTSDWYLDSSEVGGQIDSYEVEVWIKVTSNQTGTDVFWGNISAKILDGFMDITSNRGFDYTEIANGFDVRDTGWINVRFNFDLANDTYTIYTRYSQNDSWFLYQQKIYNSYSTGSPTAFFFDGFGARNLSTSPIQHLTGVYLKSLKLTVDGSELGEMMFEEGDGTTVYATDGTEGTITTTDIDAVRVEQDDAPLLAESGDMVGYTNEEYLNGANSFYNTYKTSIHASSFLLVYTHDNQTTTNPRLLTQSATNAGWYCWGVWIATNNLRFNVSANSSGTSTVSVTTEVPFVKGKTYIITGRFDGTSTIYLDVYNEDGSNFSVGNTAAWSGTLGTAHPTQNFYIGRFNSLYAERAVGGIRELRLWDADIGSSALAAEVNAESSYNSDRLFWYKFYNNDITDHSGNGHDLTLYEGDRKSLIISKTTLYNSVTGRKDFPLLPYQEPAVLLDIQRTNELLCPQSLTGVTVIAVYGEEASTGNQLTTDMIGIDVTNYVRQSEDFTAADWVANANIAVTSNTTTNPITGATTADTFAKTNTNTNYVVSQKLTTDNLVIGEEYTFSIFVKNIDATEGRLYVLPGLSVSGIDWDNDGEDYGDGWRRHSVTFTATSTNPYIYIYPESTSANGSIYVFGAMLNKGDVAGSYKANNSSTSTANLAPSVLYNNNPSGNDIHVARIGLSDGTDVEFQPYVNGDGSTLMVDISGNANHVTLSLVDTNAANVTQNYYSGRLQHGFTIQNNGGNNLYVPNATDGSTITLSGYSVTETHPKGTYKPDIVRLQLPTYKTLTEALISNEDLARDTTDSQGNAVKDRLLTPISLGHSDKGFPSFIYKSGSSWDLGTYINTRTIAEVLGSDNIPSDFTISSNTITAAVDVSFAQLVLDNGDTLTYTGNDSFLLQNSNKTNHGTLTTADVTANQGEQDVFNPFVNGKNEFVYFNGTNYWSFTEIDLLDTDGKYFEFGITVQII